MLSLNKYLKAGIQIVVFLLLFKNINSQNLIQNSGFENYTSPINCIAGGFDNYNNTPVNHVVDNWYGLNSPDYFNNLCSSSSWYNAPNGIFGYCYPYQGNAHVGFMMFYGQGDTKEYIYQQLSLPLQAGKIYCLSFFISRADRKECAVHSIGAYFSNNVQSVGTIGYVNTTPQVINQSGFITDTTQWTEIQGCFTASGGEQYITIGNFNSNLNTDTLNVGTNNPIPSDTYYSYYYIDNITLIDQTTVGVNELYKESDFEVYPNPNNGIFTISSKDIIQKIEVTNIAGQTLFTETTAEKTKQLQLNHFAQGIYFIKVSYSDGLSITKKVIVNP